MAHSHEGQPMTWCTIHKHLHIATIPDTTYTCTACGWGGWTANAHAEHRTREQRGGNMGWTEHHPVEEKHDHVRVVELEFFLPGGQTVTTLATEESWAVTTNRASKALTNIEWSYPEGYQEKLWFGGDLLEKSVLKLRMLSGPKPE